MVCKRVGNKTVCGGLKAANACVGGKCTTYGNAGVAAITQTSNTEASAMTPRLGDQTGIVRSIAAKHKNVNVISKYI